MKTEDIIKRLDELKLSSNKVDLASQQKFDQMAKIANKSIDNLSDVKKNAERNIKELTRQYSDIKDDLRKLGINKFGSLPSTKTLDKIISKAKSEGLKV